MTESRALPRVTVILVSWHMTDLVIQRLNDLAGAVSEGMRFVVVDNGSADDSVAAIRRYLATWAHSESVTLLQRPTNLGFCAGVNLGTEHALAADPPPDYIWLLNPDTVLAPETLSELVAVARETGAGIVSAPDSSRPGYAGQGRWPRAFWARPQDYLVPIPAGARWVETGRAAAWCALFDAGMVRRMIAEDGHFEDAGLFLDWDEWDVALRAQKRGYFTCAALCCGATHIAIGRMLGPSQLAKARQYYQSRNAIVITRRNLPAWRFWAILPLRFGRDLTWFIRLRFTGTKPNEWAYLQGVVDGFRGKMGRWKHHPPSPHASR